jgi:non-specific protein-tyrosine kinase
VNPDYTALLASQRLAATYASVATTRPLLDAVITSLGLKQTSDDLFKNVRADTALDSTILTISARDASPKQAAAIANALASQLIAASPALQGHQVDVQKAVDADLLATQAQIADAQTEVVRLSGLTTRTADQETRLATLQGQLVSLRATYAALLAFSSAGAANLLSVIQPAVAPDVPVWPRPLLNTLIAGIVGLLITGTIIFVAAYLDDSIKTPEEVEEVVGLATLGSVMRMKGESGRSEIYRLATLVYPRSATAEAYRMLRSNLEFASVDQPLHTLLVTSALPGDGKTITAANLAIAFALEGRRVLLVDADLRNPNLHALFDLPNEQGLTTLLRSDNVNLESITRTNEHERLRVLTSGPLPPNPAELLGSQRMRTILERLQVGQDLLIFDSPPLQAVTDAAILSSFIDGTLLVIDGSRSHRAAVRQGRDALVRANAHVVGAVLNRVPKRGFSGDAMYAAYGQAVDEGAQLPTPAASRLKDMLSDRLNGRPAGTPDRK